MSNENMIYFGYAFRVDKEYDVTSKGKGSHLYSEGRIMRRQRGHDAVQIGIYQKWHHWDGVSRWVSGDYSARLFEEGLQLEGCPSEDGVLEWVIRHANGVDLTSVTA